MSYTPPPPPEQVVQVKCEYCGQWTPAFQPCDHCGAPTPPVPAQVWRPASWGIVTINEARKLAGLDPIQEDE